MSVATPASRTNVPLLTARVLGLYALLGGIGSLAGWMLNIQRLTDWEGDGISIQPNATLCVIFSAAALLLLSAKKHRAVITFGAVVLAIGGLTLLQWISGLSFGIDALLLFGREWGRVGVVYPGRMGPPGSFSWTLIGAALVLSAGPPRWQRWVPALTLTTTAISALSLIGYLYDVDQLYAIPTLSVIALQTSTFVMALSLGIIICNPEREPMRTLLDPGGAGLLARRALPLMITVPVVLGWLRVRGQDAGLYDTGLGSAVLAIAITSFLVALMWWALNAVRDREHAIRGGRQFLATLIENSPVAIAVLHGMELRFTLMNRAYQGIDGAIRPEVGRSYAEVFPEAAALGAAEALRNVIRTGESWRVRDFQSPIGPRRATWWEGECLPLHDGHGTVDSVLVLTWEITERKLAEIALRESEMRFRGVGEAIPLIVSLADGNGNIQYVSPYWEEFSGRSPADFISGGWHDAIHPDHRPYVLGKWREALASGLPYEYEFMARSRNGEFRWLLARGVPVRDENGNVTQWVSVAADIHQRRQAEEALREADRRKDEFLATLAHELRNPLAPVRNAVQVLHMIGPAVPELQWARDVIDRQVQQMTRLIDDLMDVSRITRGKIDLKRERVPLSEVVQGAIETSRPIIKQGRHELTVNLPAETVYLDADLLRMAQVFANLLNNAAKYTEPGGAIELTAELQGSGVVVSVKDSGIGIPHDKLQSVFEMFSQVQGTLERSQGGLGIGLSLVKRLVEMHGGTIEAHSPGPGMGSEFVVRLPLSAEQPHQLVGDDGIESEIAGSPLRILIVDDNQDSASSLAMMLRLTGNEIRTAFDGQVALQVADEFRPQVVLLDIGLPKLNGYEVCREIRRRRWGTDTVVVALTGWGHDDDKRNAEEAGFDHHMVKPVDPRTLMRLIASSPARDPW